MENAHKNHTVAARLSLHKHLAIMRIRTIQNIVDTHHLGQPFFPPRFPSINPHGSRYRESVRTVAVDAMLIGKLVDELLDCYRDLRRYLTRELRNPEDAADIAQSSFLRVYSHALDAPTQIHSPRAWMFRTAKHLCIDRARHQQIIDAWANERVALLADAIAPSAETIVHHRQLAARVLAVLEALPPRRRDVFVLSRVYGYSREDIARELHITEAAVAKHVVRASVDCAQALARLAADLHEDTTSNTSPCPFQAARL